MNEHSEQEEHREELRDSAAQCRREFAELSQIYENSPVGLAVVDRDLRFVRINERMAEIDGKPASEHVGRTLDDVLPELACELKKIYQSVLDSGEPVQDTEISGTTPKAPGVKRYWLASYFPVRTEKDEIVGVLAAVTEITQRKEAERDARLNESRLGALLDLSHMSQASSRELALFAMEEAVELTGSIIGYVAFVSEDEKVLNMYAWSRSAMKECQISEKPLVYPLETTGLWGEAVRQRKPIITNDYAAPNPWKKGYPVGHVRIDRHMNVPIFDDGRIVMLAGVGNKRSDYNESDVRQLTLLMSGVWTIVKRRQAEESLLLTKFALDNASDAVYWIDENAQFVYANDAACQSLGYSREELLQMGVPDIDPTWPMDRWNEFWEINKTQGPATFEAVHRTKQGRVFPVEIKTSFIEYGGKILDCAYARDITERKRAEEALLEASQMLRLVLDTIPDYVWWKDKNSVYLGCNNLLAATAGLASTEEIVGKTDFDMPWKDTEAQNYRADDQLVMESGASKLKYEETQRTAEGYTISLRTSKVPLRNAAGEVIGVLGTFEDITERKKSEETLRSARYALDNMSDAVFLVIPSGQFMDVNEAACDLLGYSKEELLGMTVSDVNTEYPPDEWPAHWDDMREKRTLTIESPLRAKDGHLIPAEIQINFVEFEDKEYHYTFVRDISERKKTAEALRESSQMLRLVLDSIPAFVFWKDRNSVYLGCNYLFAANAGLASPEEIMGKTDLDLPWKYTEAESYRADDREVIDTGVPKLNYEETQYTADGRATWVRTSKIPLRNADGDIIGVLGTFEDITERKKAEEALLYNEQKFRGLIENIADTILMTDPEGKILYASPSVFRLFGCSLEETVGHSILEFLHPDDVANLNRIMAESAKNPGVPLFLSLRVKHKDGPWRTTEGYATNLLDIPGVKAFVGNFHDVTERVDAQEALCKANRTLAALSRVNEILVRVTQESELLVEICQAIVDVGGYRMAWVGFAEDDEEKTVRPVAHAGHEDGYLDSVKILWADNELGRGPTGTAIRTKKPCISGDVHTEPRFQPWREEADKRGYGCAISLPLFANENAIGAITLYRSEPYCVDPAEENLLIQLASDLSYGITTIRTRAERKAAEAEKRALEQRLEEHKRKFYRETILSVTDGKLDICDSAAVRPYITNAQIAVDVREASDVGGARRRVEEFCSSLDLSDEILSSYIIAVGEAITNALKHGNRSRVYAGSTEDEVWVAVKDRGTGIESLILPRAVLWRGFSTKPSLGLGYTIMLSIADRILLKTGPHGTTVVLIKHLREKISASDADIDLWAAIPDLAG